MTFTQEMVIFGGRVQTVRKIYIAVTHAMDSSRTEASSTTTPSNSNPPDKQRKRNREKERVKEERRRKEEKVRHTGQEGCDRLDSDDEKQEAEEDGSDLRQAGRKENGS